MNTKNEIKRSYSVHREKKQDVIFDKLSDAIRFIEFTDQSNIDNDELIFYVSEISNDSKLFNGRIIDVHFIGGSWKFYPSF